MKTKIQNKFIIAIAMLCGSISSCREDFDLPHNTINSNVAIDITASYQSTTRAGDDGFTDGDRFGVYVVDYDDANTPGELLTSGNRADNVLYTFDQANGKWTGATTIYWKDEKSAVDVYAYYPFVEQVSDIKNFTHKISKSQSESSTSPTQLGGYESSDLLIAKTTNVTQAGGTINLVFTHLMAGIEVSLQKGTGFSTSEWNDATKSVLIKDLLSDGTVDLTTSTVTAASDTRSDIIPFAYSDKYRAVTLPQTVSAGATIVSVAIDEHSYSLVKSEDINLVSGQMHTFTITVNRRSDSGDYEFVLTSEDITPWVDDTEFRDGIVRSYTVIEVPTYGVLEETVKSMGIDPSKVTSLKLKGTLDWDDASYLKNAFTRLNSINMYDVRFKYGYTNEWSGEYMQDTSGWDYPSKVESSSELTQITERLTNNDDVLPSELFGNGGDSNTALSHIVLPKTLKGIGNEALLNLNIIGTINLPESLIFLGRGALMNIKATGKLSLPSSLKFIGEKAFGAENSTGIYITEDLSFPDGLIAIGDGAFIGSWGRSDPEIGITFPSSLSFIGDCAFGWRHLKGNIILPQNITLEPHTENGSPGIFDSSIYSECMVEIPDGIERIPNRMFVSCCIVGELDIPNSVSLIGRCAFGQTKITSVHLSDNLKQIEEGAFQNTRITGTLTIPDKVQQLGDYCFSGNQLITGVVIGAGMKLLGKYAFSECPQIDNIRVDATEPPHIFDNTFDGVNKENVILEVPEASINAYKNHTYWGEFKHITAYKNFISNPSKLCALNTLSRQTIVLNADGEWEVASKPDWCTVSPMSGNKKTQVTVTINQLTRGSDSREQDIVFKLQGTDYTTTCKLSQYNYQYDEDEKLTLQEATKGNGELNVYFIGDGFDAKSIAEGEYLDLVKEEMKYFFGIEPYKSFRDYFNVYANITMSQETGVNTVNTWRDTKFMTVYGGCNPGLVADTDLITDYLSNHTKLTNPNDWWLGYKNLVIMVVNSTEYSGATTILDNGLAISICPPSVKDYPSDTRGTVQHEACGHGFGKLGDETITKNGFVTTDIMNTINSMQVRGWYQNISLSGKMNDVQWSHFIYDSRYSNEVDIFEGGMGYTRGVYRCETNSCMNYGIPYFSAIARQDIMKRIVEGAGESFDMEYFYAHDSKEWGDISQSSATRATVTRQLNSYQGSLVRYVKTSDVKSKAKSKK
jgi:hypothetical protein